MGKQGVYLYAIVPELPLQELGERGVDGSEVYTIGEGKLRAVVSDVAMTGELRPERRHLAAHQAVVNAVMERCPVVLPVSFGTIAGDDDGIRDLLRRYAGDLSEQMERVDGRVQMNLRLPFVGKSIFGQLLDEQPELAKLRDATFRRGHAATREEKIEFGQQIDAGLNELRGELSRRMEEAIGEICVETKSLPVRGETEMARIACLVDKESVAKFDAAVQKLAGLFDDRYSIEQSGPFPPYDFAELHLTVDEGAGEEAPRADT